MQNGSEQVCKDEIEVPELVGDGFGVELAWEVTVDFVFCDDTETLMQNKSAQDGDADVGGMLELVEDGTGLEAVGIPCVTGGVLLD